jgi:hypothetical protein
MKKVKIYLRSVESRPVEISPGSQKGKNCLALYDSNRNGAIDDLLTDVQPGSVVIWQLDRCSGIRNITRVYAENKSNIFRTEPRKRWICNGFKLNVSKDAEESKVCEKYYIEYIPCNSKEPVTIDPYLRVPPPSIGG